MAGSLAGSGAYARSLMRLNDLDFHVEIDGSGPDLVMLHGFTGSLRTWDETRLQVADFARVISIDLIGHGDSAAPAEAWRYSLDWAARDLVALLDGLGAQTVHLLGYSMGGRVALHFALLCPDRLETLILESASPGIEDELERTQRVATDAALAERILDHGIEAFVAEWEKLPLLQLGPHATQARELQHQQRLSNTPLGLANSLRGMGAGQQTPAWSSLAELSTPTLLIIGERDQRYREIAARMQARLPSAELAVVIDAGHTAHLDQPATFAGLVKAWLSTKSTKLTRA